MAPSEERIYMMVEILGTAKFIIGNPEYKPMKKKKVEGAA